LFGCCARSTSRIDTPRQAFASVGEKLYFCPVA
jgi:hypothetical protein